MTHEKMHRETFGLFEKGRYSECLAVIHALNQSERDAPLRILEAVCLYETGRHDDAEGCLRDLRICVPDSAEVCIYLGRILQERGDDEARLAFSEAVRLDPDNQEGLRWYAGYLLKQDDCPSAIPVLIRLYTLSGQSEDLCRLMYAHRMMGNFSDGLNAYLENGSPSCCRAEYLSTLSEAGRDEEVISIIDASAGCPDEEFIFLIRSLEGVSPEKADQIILPRIRSGHGMAVIIAYIRLLLLQDRNKEAIGVWFTYLSDDADPKTRILICPALEKTGEKKKAGELYSSVLFPYPPALSAPDILACLFDYEMCISQDTRVPGELMEKAGSVMHPAYLAYAGMCAEKNGLHEDARLYFQKGFRSDIVQGGLFYASFLERSGDMREWEKIVIYILKSTTKVRDIESVASAIFPKICDKFSLLKFLHEKLDSLLPLLSGKGKSIYCQVAGLLAAEELTADRYGEGMTLCLDGLSQVPPHDMRTAEHLFSVLMACKMPGLPIQYYRRDNTDKRDMTRKGLVIAGLSPAEEATLYYIQRHRVCTELELRPVCGTRRVAGLMNRLIRKISAEGWQVIVKEGMSESGEVYRYAGP